MIGLIILFSCGGGNSFTSGATSDLKTTTKAFETNATKSREMPQVAKPPTAVVPALPSKSETRAIDAKTNEKENESFLKRLQSHLEDKLVESSDKILSAATDKADKKIDEFRTQVEDSALEFIDNIDNLEFSMWKDKDSEEDFADDDWDDDGDWEEGTKDYVFTDQDGKTYSDISKVPAGVPFYGEGETTPWLILTEERALLAYSEKQGDWIPFIK